MQGVPGVFNARSASRKDNICLDNLLSTAGAQRSCLKVVEFTRLKSYGEQKQHNR